MAERDKFTIAQNIKILESLKVELLSVIAELFSGLFRGAQEQVLDALSGAIVILFNIARRVGVSLRDMDQAVEAKLKERTANPRNSLRESEEQILLFWRSKKPEIND